MNFFFIILCQFLIFFLMECSKHTKLFRGCLLTARALGLGLFKKPKHLDEGWVAHCLFGEVGFKPRNFAILFHHQCRTEAVLWFCCTRNTKWIWARSSRILSSIHHCGALNFHIIDKTFNPDSAELQLDKEQLGGWMGVCSALSNLF